MLQPLLLRQSYLLCWLAGIMAGSWLAPFFIALLLIIIADGRLRSLPRLALAAALFGAGWLYFHISLPAAPREFPAWITARQSDKDKTKDKTSILRLSGAVEDVQGLPGGRLRVLLSSVRPQDDAGAAPAPGLVMWTWENPAFTPERGRKLAVSLRLRETGGPYNPGVFNPAEWWRLHGVFLRMWSRGDQGAPAQFGDPSPLWRARAELRARVAEILAQKGPITRAEAVIPAVMFGDRRHMRKADMDLFANASLAHSLALSGQHLALAGLLGAALVMAAGRLRPQIFQHTPRSKMIVLATLPLAALYIWLGDAPPSLLRAGCMLLFLAMWICRAAPHTLADGLCGALLCLTLANPLLCRDTGFQLSVLCIAVMALALPARRAIPGLKALEARLPPAAAPVARAAMDVIFISLVISLALLPVSAHIFGTGSPWFILNVLWLPLLGLLLMPLAGLGVMLAAAGFAGAAGLAFSLAALPAQAFMALLDFMNGLGLLDLPALLRPHYTALLGFGALAAAAAMLPGRRRPPSGAARLAAAAVPLLLAAPLLRWLDYNDAHVKMSLIDVGQGQAALLEFPRGRRLLVDGGGVNSEFFDTGRAIVAPLLTANRAPRLEAVVNTHPDNDHLHGLIYILRSFSVGQYLHNGEKPPPGLEAALHEALRGVPARRMAARGDKEGVAGKLDMGGGLELEALFPPREHGFRGNNASVALRLSAGGKGLVLIPGDLERAALEHLLASGRDLSAEVLVLPHHGSARSLSRDFYRAVSPRLALVSAGRNNSYGLPSAAVMEEMAAMGVETLNTATSGLIVVEWNRKGEMIAHGGARRDD